VLVRIGDSSGRLEHMSSLRRAGDLTGAGTNLQYTVPYSEKHYTLKFSAQQLRHKNIDEKAKRLHHYTYVHLQQQTFLQAFFPVIWK